MDTQLLQLHLLTYLKCKITNNEDDIRLGVVLALKTDAGGLT